MFMTVLMWLGIQQAPERLHGVYSRTFKNTRKPVTDIVVEGIATEALWDSGSSLTLISGALYNEIKKRRTPKLLNMPQTILRTASGSQLRILGCYQMCYEIGSENRIISGPTVVVEGMMAPCIMGMDCMKANKVTLDMESGKVAFKEPNKESIWKITTCKPESIPAFSEKLINVCLQDNNKMDINGEMWCQPQNDENACPINEAIYVVNHGRLQVVLSNGTPTEQQLVVGEWIGAARHVETQQYRTLDEPLCHEINEVREQKIRRIYSHLQTGGGDWSTANLGNIPSGWQPAYLNLLNEFQDVMSRSQEDLGRSTVLPQSIRLKDPRQVAYTPQYRIPHHLEPVVHEYVDKLLVSGVIRESSSPFNSPLLLVKKPWAQQADRSKPRTVSEAYRVVHDYRRLNTNIIRDPYPMKNIYDMIDSVAQAKIWTVIDLSSGFFQQELEKTSRPYTAFGIPGRPQMEYTVSAMGLLNSANSFQRLLDYVTRGLTNTKVYVDDLIVHSNTHAEHLNHLRAIFLRLRKFNLKCKLSKMQIGCGKVNYLGYEVTRGGIRPGEAKIRAVEKWPVPTTVKEIKQFIGLCSFSGEQYIILQRQPHL